MSLSMSGKDNMLKMVLFSICCQQADSSHGLIPGFLHSYYLSIHTHVLELPQYCVHVFHTSPFDHAPDWPLPDDIKKVMIFPESDKMLCWHRKCL